ncbi:MAG: hypothetical protein ABR592_12685 [Nitriliruptorales bacterium]
MLEREWVSIRDPGDAHLRYTFDVTFLLSRYRCIYGRGCPGIYADGPDIGCCTHGAYYVDEQERERVEAAVTHDLDADVMQFHAEASVGAATEVDADGEAKTRIHNGACVFLNRAGWPAGTGCAFHLLAKRRREHPMTYKPTVCWQLPLHRSIEEQVANDGHTLQVHTIAPFERGTWGEGGADFHWWCTEEPAAFTSEQPLYRSMERELRAMVGDDVYEELRDFLEDRGRPRPCLDFLPLASPEGSR